MNPVWSPPGFIMHLFFILTKNLGSEISHQITVHLILIRLCFNITLIHMCGVYSLCTVWFVLLDVMNSFTN